VSEYPKSRLISQNFFFLAVWNDSVLDRLVKYPYVPGLRCTDWLSLGTEMHNESGTWCVRGQLEWFQQPQLAQKLHNCAVLTPTCTLTGKWLLHPFLSCDDKAVIATVHCWVLPELRWSAGKRLCMPVNWLSEMQWNWRCWRLCLDVSHSFQNTTTHSLGCLICRLLQIIKGFSSEFKYENNWHNTSVMKEHVSTA